MGKYFYICVEMCGLPFPYTQATSRTLGFRDEAFIAKAIVFKAGCGGERTLAAVMAWADSGAVYHNRGGSAS